MPYNNTHMNQSDDYKGAKKKSQPLSGDLNATHKEQVLTDQVYSLSRSVQTSMQPATSFSEKINKEALKKLDEEFPDLIKDTTYWQNKSKNFKHLK